MEVDDEKDADVNSRSGIKINKLDYMRRRGEMIAMLRGLPLPDGVSPDARARAIRQMEQQEARLRADAGKGQVRPEINGTTWTSIGPAPIPLGQTTGVRNPVSGRVLSIAVHPTNPNIVYVGTAQGGLYRTLDGGNTWVPLMDGALSLAIGAIAIDPINPTTIFVGTGEGNFCGDCFFGVGLYRIVNADTAPVLQGPFNSAASNNNAFLANSRSITKIVVNPLDDNMIYVATGSGIGGSGGNNGPNTSNRGLFRSDNAQAATPTFTKINVDGPPVTTNNSVRDIEFQPGNPTNLLVSVVNTINFTTSGVYRSTNALDPLPANVTFTRTLVSPTSEQAFNIQLAISKVVGGPTIVYAALDELDPACASCSGLGDAGGVKQSVDGGVTWTAAYLTNASGWCGGQCFYDAAIAADPTNPLNVLIGGSGDYDSLQTPNKRSTDGGVTWNKTSTGLHPDTHDIVFAPSNPLIVYHGNDGGIFKSTDGGISWTSLNNTNFNATQFVDLSTHPTDPNYMIGGTQDNGTPFLQANNTWKLGDFGDGGFSIIDQNATNTTTVTAYHTYFNSTGFQIGFARAQTTAQNDPSGWPLFFGCGGIPNGISCSDQTLFYAPMAQGPGNPNTLYFGAQSLYRSANQGPTMPAVSQQFTGPVSAIGVSLQNDNVRIVGQSNGLLFGTSTGANPLVNIDPANTVPNNFIARAVIDPNDSTAPYTAYVTLGGFGLSGGAHVYKTTNLADAGTTWTLAGTGIPDIPVNAFAIDPQNSNFLYAGTDIGVYFSLNGGTSWIPFGTGLPRVAVFDMEFQARSTPGVRVLRIATHGRGIWEIIPLSPTAAPGTIGGQITMADGAPLAGVTMTLSGARSAATITDRNGNYRFDGVDTENFYTVTPSLVNYRFAPENRSFSLLGNKSDAVFTGTPDSLITSNAIDSTEYFVRQQYLDFLGREPDQDGFYYWTEQINRCGTDGDCIRARRVDISAAFFIEQEFQQTGSFIFRLYKAGLGRQLNYGEYTADRRQVVAGTGLDSSKQAFADAFVQRAEFVQKYQANTNAASFVDALLQTIGAVGVDLSSERSNLIATYNSGHSLNESRSLVIKEAGDNPELSTAVYNQAFVLMEYFSYLKRDADQGGYDFWLNVLNNRERANYRGMVCAFLTSAEYQRRFAPLITRSNSECGTR